jgi:hypothetical protein
MATAADIAELLEDLRESTWAAYCVAHSEVEFRELSSCIVMPWSHLVVRLANDMQLARIRVEVVRLSKWCNKLALNFR